MKKIFFIITILFAITTANIATAQLNDGNIWYFGDYAGLNFSTDPPTPILDGALQTLEGSATISDSNGALLFYTDGITVWNKLHQAMPNGFGLAGDPSSTQSGVVAPYPDNPGKFYLFTVSANGGGLGFNYSIVDMNLNGGLGDVTVKNQNLFSSTTEKVTATKHANGKDIWIITHPLNQTRYHAYLLTATGLNTTPVISNIGSNHANWAGYIKVSFDGKKIAAAVSSFSVVELADFDNSTGIISNLQALTLETGARPYGIEFSPDNRLLYVSTWNPSPTKIYQYNLQAGSPDAITASKTKVGETTYFFGGLQLGPNQKIYVPKTTEWVYSFTIGTPELDVIHKPNEIGLGCNYQANAQTLGGRKGLFGLPTFLQSFFTDPCINTNLRFFTVFRKTYTCPDCTNGQIAALGIGGVLPYSYSINSGAFQSSGLFTGLTAGTYVVTIKDATGCTVSRTVILH